MPPAWPEERGALFTSRGVGGGPVYSAGRFGRSNSPSQHRKPEGNA